MEPQAHLELAQQIKQTRTITNDQRCVTSFQPLLIKAWNATTALWPPSHTPSNLSIDTIMQAALRRAGTSTFIDESFKVGLKTLIEAFNRGQPLHSFGRTFMRQLLIEMLAHRLRLEQLIKINPNIRNEKINRPIIVLGLPRSGTTLLFNLLAQDPAHRFMANWEAFIGQVPPKGRYEFQNDPRRRKAKGVLLLQRHLTPGIDTIHKFNPDGPEECTPILMQHFSTQAFCGQFNIPHYNTWLDGAEHDGTYRHHKKVLQALQWKYPSNRWLLKSPDHLPAIASIMKYHPDACIIHIHRDPIKSVASWASLNLLIRGTYYSQVDTFELGRQALKRLSIDMDRYLEYRTSHDNRPFHDVDFKQFMKNPIAQVRAIYAHFELPFSDDTASRMQHYLNKHPRHQHGVHGYSLEKFGLEEAMVQKRFRAYSKQFNISS